MNRHAEHYFLSDSRAYSARAAVVSAAGGKANALIRWCTHVDTLVNRVRGTFVAFPVTLNLF